MFVKNKENIDFKFRKNGYLAVLKANTVSYVDETKVSAEDLLGCYGQRIDILSLQETEKVPPLKETPKVVKKEDLNDSFIGKILEEIEDEEKVTKDDEVLEVAKAVTKFLDENKTGEGEEPQEEPQEQSSEEPQEESEEETEEEESEEKEPSEEPQEEPQEQSSEEPQEESEEEPEVEEQSSEQPQEQPQEIGDKTSKEKESKKTTKPSKTKSTKSKSSGRGRKKS